MAYLDPDRSIREIKVSPTRVVRATMVFDTFWRFAYERQRMFMRRAEQQQPPWTSDPVLLEHRFTNVYRASDRVSQYLIKSVLYQGSQDTEEILFRTLLFKLFNKIETWTGIVHRIGEPAWRTYSFDTYAAVLNDVREHNGGLYSGAYIMPSAPFGFRDKHLNHLRLIEWMLRDGAAVRIRAARSLADVFEILRGYPSLGRFLAFQLAIDLNYSEALDFSEMDFVVAGPGARSGIGKCFADTAGLSEEELIYLVAELADDEFSRQALHFQTLWGRPLQLIDVQNLFCEVDKYARVAHPEAPGGSGRSRIKQRYSPSPAPLPQWYPPKWGITPKLLGRETPDDSGPPAIQLDLWS